MASLGVANFNTSHVSVQESASVEGVMVTAISIHHMYRFKDNEGMTFQTNAYFNTSHVSVQVYLQIHKH